MLWWRCNLIELLHWNTAHWNEFNTKVSWLSYNFIHLLISDITMVHQEVLLILKHSLPCVKYWYTTDQLEQLLEQGVCSCQKVWCKQLSRINVPPNCLKRTDSTTSDTFDDNPIFDTSKKQFNNNHLFHVTVIHSYHFGLVDLKWLHKYLTGPVTRSTHPHLNEALQGISQEQAATSMSAWPVPCRQWMSRTKVYKEAKDSSTLDKRRRQLV